MHRAVLIAAVALLAGCGGADEEPAQPSPPATALTITIFPTGPAGPSAQWELRCDPVGGSVPDPEQACERLAELGAGAFAPTPPDVACTEQYGGPEVARIQGTLDGRPVSARLTRVDGCEIERWERVSFLLPQDDGT